MASSGFMIRVGRRGFDRIEEGGVVVGALKAPEYRGEAGRRHRIEIDQLVHHPLPDEAARDLFLPQLMDVAFHPIDDAAGSGTRREEGFFTVPRLGDLLLARSDGLDIRTAFG